MNNAKLQAQKNTLVKKQLMDESDNLLDYTQGNTKERLLGKWGGAVETGLDLFYRAENYLLLGSFGIS